ncbi:MAG: DUF1622 domain-containing protein [Gammaproteobacteria bacterium]|nr:MAG: DUF1622 domain-containing protein [Gammaproteobacteria bacterium]
MDWQVLHTVLLIVQRSVSAIGVLIILSGVIVALAQYLYYLLSGQLVTQGEKINTIRLNLGRILILGLEFIVAADLIGTTTTPDYYAVGLLAIIVIVRTLLSFSINRELMSLSKE